MTRKLEIQVLTTDYEKYDVKVSTFKTGEPVNDLSRYGLTMDEAWEYADALCEKEHVTGVFEGVY